MRINTLHTRAGLLILLAMGLTGGGVALWRDARPPQAALSRDGALQTQWRRIMALRIPDGERSGERIDKQPFSPIAIPLARASRCRPAVRPTSRVIPASSTIPMANNRV